MDEFQEAKVPRGRAGVRLIFTILCMIMLYVVHLVIQALVLVQYAILLITRGYSQPLRKFSNQVATYNYRLVRYMTLNENGRPFPFSELPPVMEMPEEPVKFD